MNLIDQALEDDVELIEPKVVFERFCKEGPEVVCYDTETPSLDWKNHLAFAATVCWKPGESYYLDVTEPGAVLILQKMLASTPIAVFHNAKFDLHVLRTLFDHHDLPMVHQAIHDTMLLDYCLDEQRHHGLKELSTRFMITGIDGQEPEELRKAIEQWIADETKSTGVQPLWDQVPKRLMVPYAIQDAHLTLQLYYKLQGGLKGQLERGQYGRIDVDHIYGEVEIPLIEVILNAEAIGMRVDLDFIEQQIIALNPRMESHRVKCREMAGWEINPGSSEDVAQVLQQFGNFDEKRFINQKTGKAKLPEWVLSDLIDDDNSGKAKLDPKLRSIVESVLAYRNDQKVLGYFENLQQLHQVESHGQAIVHCNVKQHGARTGRTSVTNPPLQTLPRSKGDVRQAFISREGKSLIFADYSGQELRVLAHFLKQVGDDSMADVFAAGGDIHWETAEAVYSAPRSSLNPKVERQAAKNFNFAIVYGAGIPKLMTMLGSPPCGVCDQCTGRARRNNKPAPWNCSSPSGVRGRDLMGNYHERFPGLKLLKSSAEERMANRGYVITPFGRRHRERDGRFAYKAINSLCQGTGADIAKSAMVKINRLLRAEGLLGYILMMVHDEIIAECPDEEIEATKEVIRIGMTDMPELAVKLEVDMAVAKCWGFAK